MPKRKKSRKTPLDFQNPNPDPVVMLQSFHEFPSEDPQSLQTLAESQSPVGAQVDPSEEMPSSSPVAVPDAVVVPDIPVPNPPPSARKSVAAGKRKKPFPGGKKRLAEIEEKLSLLSRNFRPVPFSPPSKAPDFSRHERLFRALGLWDFAHLDLDRDIRSDLLALLIANYDPPNRRSIVRQVRVFVNRADLARALGLPVKKDKAELDPEILSGDEPAAAVLDFISSWMLFQDEDNPAWILPKEVVAATQMVKEGQPHKVDWAGLLWILMEKELLEAPKTGKCYYASHLQCLMKYQKPGLFEEADLEPEVDPEPSVEATPVEEDEEEVGNAGLTRMKSLDEFHDVSMENNGADINIGLSATGGDGMNGIQECEKRQEEQWIQDGKSSGLDHCLQRCNSSDVRNTENENLIEDDGDDIEREESRYEHDLTEKFSSLERLTSTDLLQAMETANVSYSPPRHHLDSTSGDFLAMRPIADKDMGLGHDPSSSLLFGNGYKRGIEDVGDGGDDDGNDGENGVHHFSQANRQKRMRGSEPWEHSQSPYDTCMEQVQCWMGKAKMLYAEKEQAFERAQLDLQYLNAVLEQKDQIIQSLEKTSLEEQQKRNLEYCRFEHELKLMARLVVSYKKALRETRAAFADFRKQVLKDEEALYKDVPGSGGLVLSTRELEKQQAEKEVEVRRIAVEMVNAFQKEWLAKFSGYADWVVKLAAKLVELDNEVRILKEKLAESKGVST